jgi:mannonate dehydratase
MKLSMLVNPFTERNLALAAQVGVEEVVLTYPGPGLQPLRDARRQIEAAGMRLTVLERKIPHRRLVHRLPGWEEELAGFQSLLRNMAEVGMTVACYNWMPAEDWQRTTCTSPERGGALSTAFDLRLVEHNVTDADGAPEQKTPAAALWDNLKRFLDVILPVAEDCGVALALHPDDPPLTSIRGQDQIITSNEALRRVVDLAPSKANGICYCTGSLYPAGADLVAGIHALGPHIRFVHARNVRGTADNFQETWHDNGEIDMAEVIRALKAVGFEGPMRPDHAPSMAGESNETPGYEPFGKLFAIGYLRGLMDGT